jgi:anti-sigma factor RsiW
MTEPNVHALTGAYVLDALDPDEAATFRAHLDTCPECRQEVATLTATVTRLAGSAAVAPPPGMLRDVMAQVGRTPQATPFVARPAADERADDDAVTTPRERPAPTRIAARRDARRRWPALVAAAAVMVGVAVGGTVAYRDHQADRAVAAMQSEVMRIVSAPDAVTHDLDLGATHVVMSAEMAKAAVMGEEVPMPAQSGMVYQVWMLHADGSADPGPTFMPHGGDVMAVVEGDLSAVTALTVTVEPDGGSASPTGEPVASVLL